jgi:1-acyl-sn-glycerol-3-phosphate acyltransferase
LTVSTSILVNDHQIHRATSSAEQLLAIVQQLARETHPEQAPEVGLHTSFERDLGLDSLARVELMQRVGKAFGVELPSEALGQADTPRELLHWLGQAAPEQTPELAPALTGSRTLGVPADAQSLVDVLEWHAERQPDEVHILLHDEQHQEHPISYRELLDEARGIAAGLQAQGLQPKQTVALMLPTGRDYLACFFGVMIAGGIPVPIYPPARMAQIEDHLQRHARILSNAEAVLIITFKQAKQVALMLQAAVPSLAAIVTPSDLHAPPAPPRYRPQAGDIAFLQYTSGSTGDPKGVVLTHANLLANIRALGQATQAGPDDVFVSWLPLYHDMGLIGAWFGTMYHGIPLVLMSPLAFLARPALWLQTITRHHGTISAAPNFAYELCVRHISDATLAELDLSRWRLALNGAEPVSPATLESFATRFARCGLRRQALTPVYGLAESSVGLAFPPLERGPRIDVIAREAFTREGKAVPGGGADALSIPSCGRALHGQEIRIVDDAEVELPERCVGRLEFRGSSATSGYYRNPEGTSKLFRGDWLDSGDFAYMAEGEVYVTGRVKDLIKRGGRNLYPYDLEQAAGNVPGIRKGCVAVFASPDPATGSERLVIMAETRERDEAARSKLRQALNQTAVDVIGMPADDIVLVPPHAVLKTSSGKIRRLASRDAYEHGKAEQPSALPRLRTARFAASAVLADLRVAARRASAWAYGVYMWLVLAVLALPVGGLILLLQSPAQGRRIARFAARLLFRLAAVPLSAKGIERLPREPHVLLVNHSSYLDAIALTALLPAVPGYAFAAKREFAGQPVMRSLMTGLGALFVERFDARRGAEDVERMAEALRGGQSVVVFPEGTFTREAGLKPFHAGAFLAAAKAAAPLVVAGLRGTRTGLRADTWLPRRTRIGFELGPVLAPPGREWAAAVQSSTQARVAMAQLCGEFAAIG